MVRLNFMKNFLSEDSENLDKNIPLARYIGRMGFIEYNNIKLKNYMK